MGRKRKHGFDVALNEFLQKLVVSVGEVERPVAALVIDEKLWWKVFEELRRRRLVSTGERVAKTKQFVLRTPYGFVTVWRQE